MNRLILVLLLCIFTTVVNAQYQSSSLLQHDDGLLPNYNATVPNYSIANSEFNANRFRLRGAGKTTSGMDRWYSHVFCIDTLNSTTVSSVVFPIWYDSTVRQRFSTGLGTINFLAVGEVVDPIYFNTFNDATLFDPATTMRVRPTDAYIVDSVNITAAYVKVPTRPDNIVDTLIFSVAVNNFDRVILRTDTNAKYAALANNTLAAGQDTLYLPRIQNADSIHRAAFPSTGVSVPQIIWKVPIDSSLRTEKTASNTFIVSDFTSAVPGGGLHVPAGSNYAVTCTFKSGDTWTANVDSVSSRHYFMPRTDQPLGNNGGSGTQMPYYWYDLNDHNMSQLMFSTRLNIWYPTKLIEGNNTITFSQEFHNIISHISCATCLPIDVSVANVKNAITDLGAYPVPAHDMVNIPFSLFVSSDITISLVNILGQTVRTQSLKNVSSGTASFKITDLCNGVYFYQIQAGVERVNGRIVISH